MTVACLQTDLNRKSQTWRVAKAISTGSREPDSLGATLAVVAAARPASCVHSPNTSRTPVSRMGKPKLGGRGDVPERTPRETAEPGFAVKVDRRQRPLSCR